jgi:sugar transferase (PEP-CTERM/EpsH1 system associated)
VLDSFCERHELVRIGPARRVLQGTAALLSQQPLSLAWYHHPRLMQTLRTWHNEVKFNAAYVFCSSMAPYWLDLTRRESLPAVMDFIDVDSLKWSQYAEASSGPKAWVYRREHRLLEEWEMDVARAAYTNLFVNQAEVQAFNELVPEVRVEALNNGVDGAYFARPENETPATPPRVIFVGMMDYRANVDAVVWFVSEVWPQVLREEPEARFFIVGARPTAEVSQLSAVEGVTVTGRVEDVRPFLWGASVAVAPLRIAQGTQNKVLEAMAASVPVVATSLATRGIGSPRGPHVLVADEPQQFASAVLHLLHDPSAADTQVEAALGMIREYHSWESSAQQLERLLQEAAESNTP